MENINELITQTKNEYNTDDNHYNSMSVSASLFHPLSRKVTSPVLSFVFLPLFPCESSDPISF